MTRSFGQISKHIVPHVVAAGLIVVCLQLSHWQTNRADEKASLIQQWANAPTLFAEDIGVLADAPTYTKVSLTGRFDPERHILLDNQTRNNHPGVHVFVPFLLDGSDLIYLVNRGWQPWFRHLGQWPEYPTPTNTLTIQGRLSDPPRVGFQLGEAAPLDPSSWPNLMTYLDLGRIQTVLGPDVASRIILLDPEDPMHLSKDPWPSVNMGPDRHTAYAFQWLAIAVAILIIWIALSYRFYWRKK
jgi:surfeit locus 1 family protein